MNPKVRKQALKSLSEVKDAIQPTEAPKTLETIKQAPATPNKVTPAMPNNVRMVTAIVDGVKLSLPADSPIVKKLLKAVEEFEQQEREKLTTVSHEIMLKALRNAFSALSSDQQLSLSRQTLIARFNGVRILEHGTYPSDYITVRQRAPRTASTTQVNTTTVVETTETAS